MKELLDKAKNLENNITIVQKELLATLSFSGVDCGRRKVKVSNSNLKYSAQVRKLEKLQQFNLVEGLDTLTFSTQDWFENDWFDDEYRELVNWIELQIAKQEERVRLLNAHIQTLTSKISDIKSRVANLSYLPCMQGYDEALSHFASLQVN